MIFLLTKHAALFKCYIKAYSYCLHQHLKENTHTHDSPLTRVGNLTQFVGTSIMLATLLISW